MTRIHKVSSDWEARIWFEGTGWAERRLEVTPTIAGWDALSFRTYTFRAGQTIDGESATDEMAMVLLSGALSMEVVGPGFSETWEMRGRTDVFSGPPFAAYLPPGYTYKLTIHADADCAYGRAPATGAQPARLVRPEEMSTRGGAADLPERVTQILTTDITEHLVCNETIVVDVSWAFAPPNSEDDAPVGVFSEVIYYRMRPETGWAVQRLYDATGTLDETFTVRNADAVIVRGGHRPVVAGPGAEVYGLRFWVGRRG